VETPIQAHAARRSRVFGYDASEHTPDEADRAARDMVAAKRIGEVLEKHYPGHYMRVEVDSEGGIARVIHPLLPPSWCYVIHLADLKSDPGMRTVMRAGGELLERFNIPRTRYNRDRYREASTKHAKLARGIYDLEFNIDTGKVRRHIPDALAR
jgi:hypothetical protein